MKKVDSGYFSLIRQFYFTYFWINLKFVLKASPFSFSSMEILGKDNLV